MRGQQMYDIEVSEKEIDDIINQIHEIKNSIGTKYRGMSYEDGLMAMLDWLTGNDDAHPLND